ncbi:hypothetical protein VB734_04030 [Synechococcus sp. BA-124 BA4]|uniref:PulJ/GspJ family protein n=1 Tax=unclassified Synechococcus TaxID=2626047 RepID=UPI002AD382C2|nr:MULTISPECIES: hypothetical protein [unclassified Synechococcus]MEA5399206.1 hypothetical protein [Synechococcus sp. BA-124 BA4]CAK6692243.1 hypothetical protein BBFGKLBO_01196 [Synechococcus sp. CBW1107]
MTLVEVMVASTVMALASVSSAQMWGDSVAWSRRVEERQELLRHIDADLRRREHALRQEAAVAAEQAPMPCSAATGWMLELLSRAGTVLPAGAEQHLEPAGVEGLEPEMVLVVVRSATHHIERRRLFSAAAHGLCLPVATQEVGT